MHFIGYAFGQIGEEMPKKPSEWPEPPATLVVDRDGDGDFWLYLSGKPFLLKYHARNLEELFQFYMKNRGKLFVA